MVLFKMMLLFTGIAAAMGLPFYFLENPYEPGDPVPRLIGIIGSAMMFIGASFYFVRKRAKFLKNTGKLKHWLEAHILFCLIGPLLIVYHSAFSLRSPNASVAFYSMLVVVGSGVVGRYVYRHFQVNLSGERSSLKEMTEEADQLNEKIRTQFSDSEKILNTVTKSFGVREKYGSGGIFRSLFVILRLDWLEGRLRREIRRVIRQNRSGGNIAAIESLLIARIKLEKKIFGLEATISLFSYWHKLHVPFIWILMLTFVFHVISVMIF